MSEFIAGVLWTIIKALLGGYLFMVAMGDWHSHASSVPTIGYWTAVGVAVAIGWACTVFSD